MIFFWLLLRPNFFFSIFLHLDICMKCTVNTVIICWSKMFVMIKKIQLFLPYAHILNFLYAYLQISPVILFDQFAYYKLYVINADVSFIIMLIGPHFLFHLLKALSLKIFRNIQHSCLSPLISLSPVVKFCCFFLFNFEVQIDS